MGLPEPFSLGDGKLPLQTTENLDTVVASKSLWCSIGCSQFDGAEVRHGATAREERRHGHGAAGCSGARQRAEGCSQQANTQLPFFSEYLGGLCHLLLLFTPSQPLPSILYLDHYASAKGSPRRRVLFPLVVSLPVCLTAERQMFGPIL